MLFTIDEIAQKLNLGISLPAEYQIKTPVLLSSDELTDILSFFEDTQEMMKFVKKISLDPEIKLLVAGRTITLGSVARLMHAFARGDYFTDKLAAHKQALIISYFRKTPVDKENLIYLLQTLTLKNMEDDFLFDCNFVRADLLTIVNDFTVLNALRYDVVKMLYHFLNPVRKWCSSETPLLDMYYFAKRTGHILGLSNKIMTTVQGTEYEFETEYEMASVSLKLLIDCLDSFRHRFPSGVVDRIYYAMKTSVQLMSFYGNYASKNVAAILLNEYKNKELVYVSPRWDGHTVAIAIYGKYLLYCNRGEGGDPQHGCAIYEIKNRDLINEEFFKNLTEPHLFWGPKQFHEMLNTVIDLSCPIVRFRSKGHLHDTCTFVNPKSAIEGMIVLVRAGYNARKEQLISIAKQEITRKKYKHFTNYIRNREIDEIIKNMFYAQDPDLILFYANLTKAIINEHHGQKRFYIKDEREIVRAVDFFERLPDKVAQLVRKDKSFMRLMQDVKAEHQKIIRAEQESIVKPGCLLISSYNNYSRHRVSVDNKGHIVSIDDRETPRMPFSFRNARKLIAVC